MFTVNSYLFWSGHVQCIAEMNNVFTLSIWTPQLLIVLVLKFEKYNLLPDIMSKN